MSMRMINSGLNLREYRPLIFAVSTLTRVDDDDEDEDDDVEDEEEDDDEEDQDEDEDEGNSDGYSE